MTKNFKSYRVSQVAKLTKVSARTVRFYDEKDLVKPARIDENGYRVYTEKEIEKIKLVSYLKQLSFSLKDIKQLFQDEKCSASLELLINQKLQENEEELTKLEQRKKNLLNFEKYLHSQNLKNENISEVTKNMKSDLQLSKTRKTILISASGLTILELLGIGLMFLVARNGYKAFALIILIIILTALILAAILLSKYYYHAVAYVCPLCHEKFIPTFKIFTFAQHTSKFRKLRCPNCHQKSFCLEVARN